MAGGRAGRWEWVCGRGGGELGARVSGWGSLGLLDKPEGRASGVGGLGGLQSVSRGVRVRGAPWTVGGLVVGWHAVHRVIAGECGGGGGGVG